MQVITLSWKYFKWILQVNMDLSAEKQVRGGWQTEKSGGPSRTRFDLSPISASLCVARTQFAAHFIQFIAFWRSERVPLIFSKLLTHSKTRNKFCGKKVFFVLLFNCSSGLRFLRDLFMACYTREVVRNIFIVLIRKLCVTVWHASSCYCVICMLHSLLKLKYNANANVL